MEKHFSIQNSLFYSISKNDNDLMQLFCSNIVLAGGNTMFEGINERIQKELKEKVSSSTEINVFALPERKHLSWIGGSLLSSLSSFENYFITLEQYEEYGPSLLHKM